MHIPVRVQSIFVMGTNKNSSLLQTAVPVEGRQRAIAICMLKGHPERVCDMCSKSDCVGGTGLPSVTRPMKPYQLPATEGEPLSFPICITVIRIRGRRK